MRSLRKLLAFLIILPFLVLVANADNESWTESASIYKINFASAVIGTATNVQTLPVPIDTNVDTVSFLIKSGTSTYYSGDAVSGAISNASVVVGLSPSRTSIPSAVTDGVPAAFYLNAGASTTFLNLSNTITNYGYYEIPVGSARYIYFQVHGNGSTVADSIEIIVRARK